jgi:hypothetical protein
MGNLLYVVAVLLVLFWAIGLFGMGTTSPLIHILLVIAVIAVLLRVIRGSSV